MGTGAGLLAGALAVLALAGCGGGDGDEGREARGRAGAGGDVAAAPAGGGGFRPGRVTFGVLAPLSGAEAARGRDLADGARMAVAELNVRGGVLGQKAAVAVRDDGCAAAEAKAAARALRSAGVAGALGGVCTGAARAEAEVLGDGLPFLVTSASSPGIVSARRTPTAYLLTGTPYQAALATIHWFAYASAQRLSVVTEADGASKALGREVLGLASPVPKAVSQQAVPAGTEDWGTIVKAALAGQPDTVYWAGSAEGGGALLAALRADGYEGTFVASAEAEDPAFVAAAGTAAEGAYVVAPARPQTLPSARDWTARFAKRFGRAPGRDALYAYDGLRALAQAVTQSGKVDAERNSAELARLDEGYVTSLGDAGLPFASDHTVRFDENIVLRVRGGKLVVENLLRSER
jgi:branched-chain amino acid transport system substrate-binding protein